MLTRLMKEKGLLNKYWIPTKQENHRKHKIFQNSENKYYENLQICIVFYRFVWSIMKRKKTALTCPYVRKRPVAYTKKGPMKSIILIVYLNNFCIA